MQQIKSRGTGLEREFFKKLWKQGIRYRKHPKGLYGKPDLAIKNLKTVIFIDSCFWHGCKRHLRMPKSNVSFWKRKIERNRKRDKEVNEHYKAIGWRVIRVWEHQIKKNPDNFVKKITNSIKQTLEGQKL